MCMLSLYHGHLHIIHVLHVCLWGPEGTGTQELELQTPVNHSEGAWNPTRAANASACS